MKTAIVIIVFNLDHRVFLLQIEAIKKFCTDNYVIEVIDNSTNLELSEAIKYHAQEQGVSYRKTNPVNADPSHSHAFAANLAYKILFEFYDYFFFLDHDCIPLKPFSVVNTLGEKTIAGVQVGIETKYYWPGCLMFNNKKVNRKYLNFNPIHHLRIDTGGQTYRIINQTPDECIFFDEVGHYNEAFRDTELYYFYMVINEGTFMHFLNSSGWNPTERNEERINSLINIAQTKIDLYE